MKKLTLGVKLITIATSCSLINPFLWNLSLAQAETGHALPGVSDVKTNTAAFDPKREAANEAVVNQKNETSGSLPGVKQEAISIGIKIDLPPAVPLVATKDDNGDIIITHLPVDGKVENLPPTIYPGPTVPINSSPESRIEPAPVSKCDVPGGCPDPSLGHVLYNEKGQPAAKTNGLSAAPNMNDTVNANQQNTFIPKPPKKPVSDSKYTGPRAALNTAADDDISKGKWGKKFRR